MRMGCTAGLDASTNTRERLASVTSFVYASISVFRGTGDPLAACESDETRPDFATLISPALMQQEVTARAELEAAKGELEAAKGELEATKAELEAATNCGAGSATKTGCCRHYTDHNDHDGDIR